MQNNNIKSNFFKGVRQALPIVLGYIPIGLSFGILAADTLRHTGIFLMSLLVYAGSAQFISVSMLAGQASAISVIVTVFLVNLRHLLFSASLSPYARAIPARLLALISFEMTDESFAVEIQEARKSSPPAAYYFGLHLTAHASWIAATVAGGMLGALIPDPAKWGIDFALPAMFIALLTAQVKRKTTWRSRWSQVLFPFSWRLRWKATERNYCGNDCRFIGGVYRMSWQKILLIIIGMGLVTYLPRMLPLVILSRIKLPAVFINWLKYIPAAVLSALLLPGILINDKKLDISPDNHAKIASIPCFIAEILSKNMYETVVTGDVSMLVLKCVLS